MELIHTSSSNVIDSLNERFGVIYADGVYSRGAIANICRHTAGLLCPVNKRSLVKSIVSPLEPLGFQNMSDFVSDVVDTLISQGDLLESIERMDESNSLLCSTLLYVAPPQYISLSASKFVLLGVAPDNTDILPTEIMQIIQSNDCLRYVIANNKQVDLKDVFRNHDLFEIDLEQWLQAPQQESAEVFIARLDEELFKTSFADDILELSILDPNTPSDYYLGRWVSPSSNNTGNYIAKRPIAFNQYTWCYISLDQGCITHLLDLPFGYTLERGCDQAWRAQSAIDFININPQTIKIESLDSDKVILKVFSPIPNWLERRWCSLGHRGSSDGCLTSFILELSDVEREIGFSKERMWLECST